MPPDDRSSHAGRDPAWWQLPLVLGLSIAFESLFLRHGLNVTDEGWPLYAAMRLHAGGVLYQDTFFVFPPGHLLPAWIGLALAPPGLLGARLIYAAFVVALCGALYLLGRRIGTPAGALLGACLVAVAAPDSHHQQLLFGYRYLVFGAAALLCVDRRLRGGPVAWLAAAGALTGVGLCFRLTPAFATALAIGATLAVAARDPRSFFRDAAWAAGGFALVVVPVVAWFAADVGLERLWHEVVARPVAMTVLQSRPVPDLAWPTQWNRLRISEAAVPLMFRLVPLLYALYTAVLVRALWRARRRGERFESALLLGVVVWGTVYFTRSLGRSDAAHLDSALPPVCLLLGHAVGAGIARWRAGSPSRGPLMGAALGGLVFCAWVGLLGSDTWLSSDRRGGTPLESTGGATRLPEGHRLHVVDEYVARIRTLTEPGDTILDLSVAPLLLVLAERTGPGWSDVVMPGSFADEAEERAFIARLEAAPPALVILPTEPFDGRAERSTRMAVPRLHAWIRAHYSPVGRREKFILLVPKNP